MVTCQMDHLLGHIQINGAQKPFTHKHRQIQLFEFPLGVHSSSHFWSDTLISELRGRCCHTTVQEALKPELEITAIDCYTDSQVALCWIRGTHHEWKQFVHNRVTEIRALVPPVCWKHCPGIQNPADIPSIHKKTYPKSVLLS